MRRHGPLVNTTVEATNARGSLWHRWDPHIHTPGTVLNDQFVGTDPFADFLHQVESSDPPIRALGVTDYCGLDCYEKVMAAKKAGHLPGVTLVFANVELRYSIETAKGSAVNVHLLFSPDAPDHVALIKRFLATLEFRSGKETYRCTREDLISLGKAYDSSVTDDVGALKVGATQFKVDLTQLRQEWGKSEWAQSNGLIAVSGGDRDGTSGLRDTEGAFGALRKEVEATAHIIFSGNPKQTEFWLGKGSASPKELEKTWGGKKPCLHGSDAHKHAKVGAPDHDRYCWLKGDLTFETLRQACIDPDDRVFIGLDPPRGGLPSHTIAELEVLNAPWLSPRKIALNAGIVAVIGARGSGKTALADFIAAGGYALSKHLNPRSFIARAREHLTDSTAVLAWEAGEQTSMPINATEMEDLIDHPRVQYLSQQFVDQLCSAEGINNELLEEIERVIFQAHPPGDRLGADSFKELLDLRTERTRASRARHETALRQASDDADAERARRANKPGLLKQQEALTATNKKDIKDRASLIGKGQEERVRRLNEVNLAVDAARLQVDRSKRRLQQLLGLKDEVKDLRDSRVPGLLAKMKEQRSETGLSDEQWQSFGLKFVGDVDAILERVIADVHKVITMLSGPAAGEVIPDVNAPPSPTPYIAADADLTKQTLSLLDKEQTRLRSLIGVDTANAKKLSTLSDKIAKQEAALVKLAKDIERAAQADGRIKEAMERIRLAYEGIIASRIEEESELTQIYAPLAAHLSRQAATLRSLTFSVRRVVDVEAWAGAGEKLLDLRVQGPFKGKGALLEIAKAILLDAWESGSTTDVSKAMTEFREKYAAGLVEQAPVSKTDKDAYRQWIQSVANWLYSTDHIAISYGVQFDGMNIERLSPGTRGIVLLMLYLAIDGEDDRPLLIDQPEENLDPQSIFQELVHRFRDARTRRQIIIVTHNANLVVNTDADQVIVATCGPHRPGQLPEITYESGGLENREIRKHVCDILEGGEAAFRERAKRLRVKL
jgi:energy-coupling factor transporter ATP-binding protein EcfA2